MSLATNLLAAGLVYVLAGLSANSVAEAQTADPAVAEWNTALANHIRKFKQYPQGSRKRGEQGLVIISFTIDSKGKLLGVRLPKRTCFEDLNEEAIAMVKRAEPFPLFPAALKLDRKSFSIPMNYRLAGVGPSEPIDQRAIDACFTP